MPLASGGSSATFSRHGPHINSKHLPANYVFFLLSITEPVGPSRFWWNLRALSVSSLFLSRPLFCQTISRSYRKNDLPASTISRRISLARNETSGKSEFLLPFAPLPAGYTLPALKYNKEPCRISCSLSAVNFELRSITGDVPSFHSTSQDFNRLPPPAPS